MAYSALCDKVFEDLNLFLIIFYTYVADVFSYLEIAPLHNTEFWLEFCHGWSVVIPSH